MRERTTLAPRFGIRYGPCAMGMEIDIDVRAQQGYCLVVIRGPLEPTGIETGVARLVADPAFRPGLPTVFDLSSTELGHLTPKSISSIHTINARYATRRGQACVALVAPDDLRFGVARMIEALGTSENLRMQVFRDFDAAVHWAVTGA